MSDIKGFTKANLQINTEDHGIKHVIGEGAALVGGKLNFKGGLHILGEVLNCDEITCDATLVIAEGAKVNATLIKAQCLINLGELRGDRVVVPGTLVAWSGSIHVAQIEYAAFEKSADCVVKGSLDQIEGKPGQAPSILSPASASQFRLPIKGQEQDVAATPSLHAVG